MKTRSHYRFLYVRVPSFLVLILFFVAAGHNAAAQTATHTAHVNNMAKPADIVRDPTDVPPPTSNRAPVAGLIESCAE